MILQNLIKFVQGLDDNKIYKYGLSYPFSWRGKYDEVCFSIEYGNFTKDQMMVNLVCATLDTFEGYKGGEYTYDLQTRVNFEEDYGSYSDGEYENKYFMKFITQNKITMFDNPKNIEEVEDQINSLNNLSEPIWQINEQSLLSVYIHPNFLRRIQSKKFVKETVSDSMQIYKCLRNIQHGFNKQQCYSTSGKDGIFKIDVDKQNNFMTKCFRKVQQTYSKNMLIKEYSLDENCEFIPIRVVAHPNKIRVRPLGYMIISGNNQTLILLDIAVERK